MYGLTCMRYIASPGGFSIYKKKKYALYHAHPRALGSPPPRNQ